MSVRQGREAIRGLSQADFEVLDNGVPQEVTLVGVERTPVNVVLALDLSGSVQGTRLTQLRAAGARLVELLAPGDAGALVAFTELVTIRSGFTDAKAVLLQALETPSAGSDTALRDATYAAPRPRRVRPGRPLVIVFSDGADTASFLSPILSSTPRAGPSPWSTSNTCPPGPFGLSSE